MQLSKFAFLLCGIVVFLHLVSCKSSEPQIGSFVEQSGDVVDSINDAVIAQTIDTSKKNPFKPTGGKGATQKAFEAWFRQCARNDAFKKAAYLGIPNPYYLGSVMSTNLQDNKYDFSKLISDTAIYKKFVTQGSITAPCDLSQMKDFSLNFFLGGTFFSTVSATLKTAITNAKSITVTTGNWSIDYLDERQFIDYLNSSKDSDVIAYRNYILTSNNYIITKVVKITSFNAKICIADTLNPSVDITLKNEFNFNVIPTDTTKKIGFTLGFIKATKDTITVSSTGVFYALAQIAKAQTVQK